MESVNQVAVPATIVLVLTYIFDYGKLLLANTPGFRQSDADHAKHIQLVFFAVCMLIIGAYTFFSAGHPADLNGWIDWLTRVAITAGGMAFSGSLVYGKVSMNGGKVSEPVVDGVDAPADATQNGLPLSAVDAAQMGQ
jgi:cytochrome bd-type quinol oxidase subunit 2